MAQHTSYDNIPNIKFIPCPHSQDRPTNDASLIDLGSDTVLVLCQHCANVVTGYFVTDIVKQMNEDTINSIKTAVQKAIGQ